jgi:hypothetical protein
MKLVTPISVNCYQPELNTLLNESGHIEETATQIAETKKLNFLATERASILTLPLQRGFLVSNIL